MQVDAISFCATPQNKSHEQLQNEALLKLYKQWQEKPFDYAVIDYYKNQEPKIKTFSTQKDGVVTKLSKFLKRIFKNKKI